VTVTLDWLGCATYRLSVDGLVIFLDTFMDRVSTAPTVGLTNAEVTEADFVLIGHAHFDHLAGADVIAKATGAKVIGSFESMRVLREAGVPEEQLIGSQGGEHHRLNEDVTVKVFPSLHSCIWTRAAAPGTELTGDQGLTQAERAEVPASMGTPGRRRELDPALATEMQELRENAVSSNSDGGALDYLITTPQGTIYFQDSMGYWTGVISNVQTDIAILAASGRGNIDGEPIQGSVEQFVAGEVQMLQPKQVILGHHDNWMGMPDTPDIADLSPVHDELKRVAPDVELIEVGYLEGTTLFSGGGHA
jgi:L-ascorbate metabolism protein UlaG (beta-lactamase superfamily)